MAPDDSEADRLAALRATSLLDSPFEVVFDRLTAIAARALKVPVALISLVDSDRQFFKSQQGLPLPYAETRETPLSHSFCQHVVTMRQPLIVEDARQHPLLASNLAVRDFNVIGYAGVPLIDSNGYCLGSLCAIDTQPRAWTEADIDLLHILAAQTMTEIELRTRALRLHLDLTDLQAREADRRMSHRLTVHDLRTPLNSLILNLEVLFTLDLNSEQHEWVTLAQSSGNALKDLVNDLVDSEAVGQRGVDALMRSSCGGRVLAESALDQVKASARARGLALRLDIAPNLPEVRVDIFKITRVLVNLLGNSIKFTPSGGQVTLSVTQRDADRLAFAVVDTGIGFKQEQAGAIFGTGVMLDKTSRTAMSTGWGLEFCKRVVEAHRGTIEVKSQVGQGSEFTIVLPVAGEA